MPMSKEHERALQKLTELYPRSNQELGIESLDPVAELICDNGFNELAEVSIDDTYLSLMDFYMEQVSNGITAGEELEGNKHHLSDEMVNGLGHLITNKFHLLESKEKFLTENGHKTMKGIGEMTIELYNEARGIK